MAINKELDMDQKLDFEKSLRKWEKDYDASLRKLPTRKKKFTTQSEITVEPLYTPRQISESDDYLEKLGFPGEYPYTRGVYASMYRNRIWTKRLLVGYGAPEDLNERNKMLLSAGETGLNVTGSSVSMRGYDTDQMAEELDRGYVGMYGTPLDSVLDTEISLKDIPIDKVSVNYSDQGPFVSTATHFVVAQRRGIPLEKIVGSTNHADCFSHWISCAMYILFPLDAHVKMTVDLIKWCSRSVRRWHPLSIIGQHYSQNGATPVQELAFTLASGIAHVDNCLKAGMDIDEFAPRISGFFDGQINVFELAAKLRAARRMWASIMKNRFKAKDPRSWQLRIHVQTSGVELTRQVPHLNIARVACQALGAVLGGCNSLHTDSWDEAITIPSEKSALLALMTQHVISEETGVADVIDPLGGSYYLEFLTDRMEQEAWKIIENIDAMGGMMKAAEDGYVYRNISNSVMRDLIAVKNKERVIVGVNEFCQPEEESSFESFKIDPELVDRQMERTKRLRKERNQAKAKAALDELRLIAEGSRDGNIFEGVIDAIKLECTRGEIVRALQDVFGKGKPYAGV
jgi:methylmalonyl-CoA mutase N-terminal domain/subunit